MKSSDVSRREVIVGALATAIIGGQAAARGDDAAKPSARPPGRGDGQLVAAQLILRGYGGESPVGTAFHELLGLKPGDHKDYELQIPRASTAAELWLFNIRAGVGPESADPVLQFEAAFLRAARWLLDRPEGAFEKWRQQGRQADVVVDLHVSSTQHGRVEGPPNQIVVPPRFLLACSAVGLPVVLSFYC